MKNLLLLFVASSFIIGGCATDQKHLAAKPITIWPCRGHDAARTGRSPFTVPEPTGVKWFFTLEKCERTKRSDINFLK
jgi:hypothetical protein